MLLYSERPTAKLPVDGLGIRKRLQAGDRFAGFANNNALSIGYPIQKFGKVCLGFVDIYYIHSVSLVD